MNRNIQLYIVIILNNIGRTEALSDKDRRRQLLKSCSDTPLPMTNIMMPMTNIMMPLTNIMTPLTNIKTPLTNIMTPMTNIMMPMTLLADLALFLDY